MFKNELGILRSSDSPEMSRKPTMNGLKLRWSLGENYKPRLDSKSIPNLKLLKKVRIGTEIFNARTLLPDPHFQSEHMLRFQTRNHSHWPLHEIVLRDHDQILRHLRAAHPRPLQLPAQQQQPLRPRHDDIDGQQHFRHEHHSR